MLKGMRRHRKIKPVKPGEHYRSVWRIVDGAVLDCFKMHPDYVSPHMMRSVRESIVKRVTGAIVGHRTEAERPRGRSGEASG